ncbi:MAG: hypothetical protein ABL897_07670 [Hyphomicrobium sp.]
MFKIASLIWIVLGTTLAGIAMIVVLTVPQFGNDAMRMIPIAVAIGAVLAIPLSMLIAKRLQGKTARR